MIDSSLRQQCLILRKTGKMAQINSLKMNLLGQNRSVYQFENPSKITPHEELY